MIFTRNWLRGRGQPTSSPWVLPVIVAILLPLSVWGLAVTQFRAALSSPGDSTKSRVTQFLLDESGSLTAAEILKAAPQAWTQQSSPELATCGDSTATVWCRIRFSLPGKAAAVIELPTTRIDHVDWFAVTGDRAEFLASNRFRDVADATLAPVEYPSIQLQPAADQEYQVLFKATAACALAIPIRIDSAANRRGVELSRCAQAHFEIGGAVAIVIICMTLALFFGDLSLGLLGFCGVAVVCYSTLFDTVLALPGYCVPAWMPRTGCSVFCMLQAVAMLAFCRSSQDQEPKSIQSSGLRMRHRQRHFRECCRRWIDHD